MGVMRDYIGDAAMYEQLAEESTELAKAALKKARILRGENPTPITTEEADANVEEEFTDVITCTEEVGLKEDRDMMKMKKLRFIERIRGNMKKLLPFLIVFVMILSPLTVHAAPPGYNKYGSLSEEYWYDDLELLACLVWAEAGNQDLKGKQLVADVVLNRMYDERFPDTISEVIYQPGQFYKEGDPRLNKAFYNVTDDCFEAVKLEALGEGRIDSRVFFYCAGFYSQYGEIGYQYGDHCFNFF